MLRVALVTIFILLFDPNSSIKAGDGIVENSSSQFENTLNQKGNLKIDDIFAPPLTINFKEKYKLFKKKYPESKWLISRQGLLKDGREVLKVKIKGKVKSNGNNFAFNAEQMVVVRKDKNKVVSHEVINELSILKSEESDLIFSINIPDFALTGSRYDIDIILEDPLNDAILAGGLIELNRKEIDNHSTPRIPLEHMSGGGLFKSTKAPMEPGVQNWAALLAHRDGLIAITKQVRIVSEEEMEIYK